MFLRRLLRFLPGGPYAEGLRAYDTGDYEAARRRFRAYLDQPAPRFRDKAAFHLCEACVQAGEKALEAGRYETAATRLREALALHPEYADVHNKLGEALLLLGRRQEAVASFRDALRHNPRYYRARLNLARALLAEGEPEAAMEALVEMQRACPPLLRGQAADLVRRCREGDLEAMRAALEQFRNAAPDEFDLRRAQALEAIHRGDNGLAVSILAGLLQTHGHYADLHHLLGLAYGNAGMLDDAILEFRRALELNPRLTKARINLGVSLLEGGQYAEAAAELRAAEEAEPCNPLVLNALRELATLTEA